MDHSDEITKTLLMCSPLEMFCTESKVRVAWLSTYYGEGATLEECLSDLVEDIRAGGVPHGGKLASGNPEAANALDRALLSGALVYVQKVYEDRLIAEVHVLRTIQRGRPERNANDAIESALKSPTLDKQTQPAQACSDKASCRGRTT